MAKPRDPVPQYISSEVNGRAHAVSYVEKDGWLEVRCEHGTKRAAVHEMPLKSNERKIYIEGLARILASEFRH